MNTDHVSESCRIINNLINYDSGIFVMLKKNLLEIHSEIWMKWYNIWNLL